MSAFPTLYNLQMENIRKRLRHDGYVTLRMPGHHLADAQGYVREHRLVMEQKLGRRLEPGEVVHHIDEDRTNNAPENLELFTSNGEHLRATRTGRVPKWSDGGKVELDRVRRSRVLTRDVRDAIRKKLEIPLDMDDIERRHAAGESITAIARDLGVKRELIYARRRRLRLKKD